MTRTVDDAPARRRWSPLERYRRSLWLLTTRDLKVRYSTSALGYLWSIIDPLVMAAIYWFVFTQIFDRGVGHEPYVVFLLTGLLPWVWFNGAVADSTVAFSRNAKLIRSTTIPRTIWVGRLVLSKGIEFLLSIPVLVIFVVANLDDFADGGIQLGAFWWLLAIPLQAILTLGVGLIVAPLVMFFHDLERAVKLALRALFYASPIVYGIGDLPDELRPWSAFNPLTGIFSLYRSAFFPEEFDVFAVAVSVGMSVVLLVIGLLVFRGSLRAVLKEI